MPVHLLGLFFQQVDVEDVELLVDALAHDIELDVAGVLRRLGGHVAGGKRRRREADPDNLKGASAREVDGILIMGWHVWTPWLLAVSGHDYTSYSLERDVDGVVGDARLIVSASLSQRGS